MIHRSEIRIRDPFILTDKGNGCYYMYGTTELLERDLAAGNAFCAYKSVDLEWFEGPFTAFRGTADFWADRDFWAPEVYEYGGRYYLFGSLKAEGHRRATQVFSSESPLGPFVLVSDAPATPAEWESLDGTLWVEDGVPYMVFCHEWVQVGDGEICAMPLDGGMKVAGAPVKLFSASESAWAKGFKNERFSECLVTDGPFIVRGTDGLIMIWSSLTDGGDYAIGQAYAKSLFSGWRQDGEMLFSANGGHGMIFTDLQGETFLSLHQPNTPGEERAQFFPVSVTDKIRLK